MVVSQPKGFIGPSAGVLRHAGFPSRTPGGQVVSATILPFPTGRRTDAALAAAEAASGTPLPSGAPWRPRLNCMAGWCGRVGIVRELDLTRGRARVVFDGWQTWAPAADLLPPSTEGLKA